MDKHLNDFEKTLCTRLRTARKEAGISLYALEKSTGISRSTLQRYETGKSTRITNSSLQKIAAALNVTPSYLMGFESKSLSKNYYDALNKILNEIGYTIEYDNIDDAFYLVFRNELAFPITETQIKDLKETVFSYLKFKLNEIMYPKQFSSVPPTTE